MENVKLGSLAAERELKALQIIDAYEDEDTCPVWQLDKALSEQGDRLWIHQIYLIVGDLMEYGLIHIHGKEGWYRYSLTDKGKQFLNTKGGLCGE